MPSLGDTLFGLAGLLVLVGLLPPLAQRLRVPNGVLLAGLGCVLGLLAGFGPHLPGPAGHLLGTLGALRPSSEVFLLIFLPVLLFEAALPLDVRDLLDDLAPVLLLAIVAVVLTTLTVGVAVAAVSPLGLVAACLLGAIVATTDPGAVIAIFREVGAPRRLTKLVEGESLLNDAAAIALFALLIELLSGPAVPVATVALGFVWSFVGGALFGAAAGRLGALVLRGLGDIRAAEVTVSVALPYLVFLAAQDQLALSGVVAVVAAGIVFGTDMRVSGHPASWSTLGAIWPQLGFWATSLIFVLAALQAPGTLGALGTDDLIVLLVVIAATLAARAACLFGLVPLLSSLRLAQPIGTGFKLVMLWGGLRGAVTLALALGVIEDPRVPAGIDVTIAGLATGLVLFTLFVQAPTLRPLIRRVGLDRLSPTDRALRDRALVLAGRTIAERIHDAAGRRRHAGRPARRRPRDPGRTGTRAGAPDARRGDRLAAGRDAAGARGAGAARRRAHRRPRRLPRRGAGPDRLRPALPLAGPAAPASGRQRPVGPGARRALRVADRACPHPARPEALHERAARPAARPRGAQRAPRRAERAPGSRRDSAGEPAPAVPGIRPRPGRALSRTLGVAPGRRRLPGHAR
jgi:CPA1 family monovalent cation:H+ antiporter